MAIPPTSVTLREGSLLHVGIIQIMEEAAFLSFASDGLPLGTFVLAYEGEVKKKKKLGDYKKLLTLQFFQVSMLREVPLATIQCLNTTPLYKADSPRIKISPLIK